MHLDKPVYKLPELIEVTGYGRWKLLQAIEKGKLKFRRDPPFSGHFRFEKEWVEEYLNATTSGGTAHGRKAA